MPAVFQRKVRSTTVIAFSQNKGLSGCLQEINQVHLPDLWSITVSSFIPQARKRSQTGDIKDCSEASFLLSTRHDGFVFVEEMQGPPAK